MNLAVLQRFNTRAFVVLSLTLGIIGGSQWRTYAQEGEVKTLAVESKAFKSGEPLDVRFSAYGDGVSPPLLIKKIPEGTKSMALICDDPDAPTREPFVHWVMYNIPPAGREIPEGLPRDVRLTVPEKLKGATQGVNGIRQVGYFGPRPPNDGKTHHYHFTVYALDLEPELKEGLNKQVLLIEMEGHILARGELVGTYKKE